MNITSVIRFCREHGTPKLRACPPLRLAQYVAWAAAQRYLVTAGPDDQISAVGIAWPVRNDGLDPKAYHHPWDPMRSQQADSDLLYVANLSALDAEGVRSVLEQAAHRWPRINRFLAHRTGRDGVERVRVYRPDAAPKLYLLAHEC